MIQKLQYWCFHHCVWLHVACRKNRACRGHSRQSRSVGSYSHQLMQGHQQMLRETCSANACRSCQLEMKDVGHVRASSRNTQGSANAFLLRRSIDLLNCNPAPAFVGYACVPEDLRMCATPQAEASASRPTLQSSTAGPGTHSTAAIISLEQLELTACSLRIEQAVAQKPLLDIVNTGDLHPSKHTFPLSPQMLKSALVMSQFLQCQMLGHSLILRAF